MLTHRGPDEAGYLVNEGVALGHLRLSIIDLTSGQQPMSSHDGRYWIVFNGEIFNYIELRKELEARGHRFLTQSDTEVLINAYREWGTDCLERCNGQWAFAIWDRADGSFLLARDRWGIRPLFYSILPDGRTLIFASEIKSILADPRVIREWDMEALRDIFACWVSEFDRTPLCSVRQVPPGSYLKINGAGFKTGSWWSMDYSPEFIEWGRSPESWCEELQRTLAEACTLRLRADVPVGAYLSGGLDSGIIASLVRANHRRELRTFSISFSEPGYDESEYQRRMAAHLQTVHQEVQISRDSIAEGFRKAIWHAETPIYRTAPVPMLLLAKLVRENGFKVVLTGEGADEIFAGYDQFKEDKIRRFWARNPDSSWRRRLLDRLNRNATGTTQRSRAFWYAFFEKDLTKTALPAYSHRIRWLNGLSLLPLLANGRLRNATCRNEPAAETPGASSTWIESLESSIPSGFERWPDLSKAQYWESRQLLSGYLLSSQGDRMAMAYSVEGRYPFLDHNIFNLARRIPPDMKLRGLQEKYLLKKAFSGDLPVEIVSRLKNPYRAPDASALLSSQNSAPLLDSLSPAGVRRRGLLDADAVSKLIKRAIANPEASARDNMAVVLAYSAHLFHDLFIDGAMQGSKLPPLNTRVELGQMKTSYREGDGASTSYRS